MAYYSVSRSSDVRNTSDDKYSTQCIYTDSLSSTGSVAMDGRSITNGYIINLANPIMLDLSTRYVMSLLKATFDTTDIGGDYVSVLINCDLIEYQYVNNTKQQLLTEIYKVGYNASFYQTATPFQYEVNSLVSRFINPTTKIITQIGFTLDMVKPDGTIVPLPPGPKYPTQLCINIKQVPKHVMSTTII
jgi:hypothetical protein